MILIDTEGTLYESRVRSQGRSTGSPHVLCVQSTHARGSNRGEPLRSGP